MGGLNRKFAAFTRLVSLIFLFVLAAFCFAATPALPQTPAQVSPPLRVQVNRVNVGVIVTDSHGHFVGNLQQKDFHVFDDGVEQPITNFATFDEPAAVLVLVEAGPAVYLLQGQHLRAAYALLNGLSAGDRVAVVRYTKSPQVLCDFTTDKRAAMDALNALSFNLGFASLNLSSSLSTVLDWLGRVPGKKSVVLLSTGVDTSTAEQIDALLARPKTEDIRVFAISLGEELKKSPGKNGSAAADASSTEEGFAQAGQLLRTIAESTGGRAYFPNKPKQFSAVYSQIAQLVRHEYSIAFAPPSADRKIHSIEVHVGTPPSGSSPAETQSAVSPAYHLDYRRAYLAPASSN
jgi:Ca-activated chloride channel homolog